MVYIRYFSQRPRGWPGWGRLQASDGCELLLWGNPGVAHHTNRLSYSGGDADHRAVAFRWLKAHNILYHHSLVHTHTP